MAVDIRSGSQTQGQCKGSELAAQNGYQQYVYVGFARGFFLETDSEIANTCTDYCFPETEGAVLCGVIVVV